MITTDDIITFLNDYDNPTTHFMFDIDLDGLERFVRPETNLYSLILLSKAREQGLDIVFVDKEKFFNVSVLDFRPTVLETGPDEGSRYVQFELAPLLHDGYTFTYNDYAESMGVGFVLNTMNFGNEIIDHFLEGTGKETSTVWYDDVFQIHELTDHINKALTTPEPKNRWFSKLSSPSEIGLVILNGIGLLLYGIFMCIYFIYKCISKVYGYIDHWLHKPLNI
jgi:hypothetical protein